MVTCECINNTRGGGEVGTFLWRHSSALKRCKSVLIKPLLRKTSNQSFVFSERFKYQCLSECEMRIVAVFAFDVLRRWDVFGIFSQISHLMFHVNENVLAPWNNKGKICHGWNSTTKEWEIISESLELFLISIILKPYFCQTGHRYHCLLFWCAAKLKGAIKMQIAIVFCARSRQLKQWTKQWTLSSYSLRPK